MRTNSWRFGLLILFCCSLLYLWGLGALPFYTKGEPREATVVWEIYTSGEWILPLRNGHIIPSKPPLFHWLGALLSLGGGELNELSIRLPSALLAITGVLLTYLTGVSLWGAEAGLIAGLILATSFEWVRAATTARVDMTLTVCMVAAFLFFQFLYRRGAASRLESLFFFLLLGLATLAKGPVGALLPGLTIVVFLLLRRDLGFLKRLSVISGGILFILVAGSWYGLALWQGGDAFFRTQIMKENVMRFFASNAAGAGHEHPFYYFIPNLFLGMAPWSFFLPALAYFLYQRRKTLHADGLLYPLVWAATVFLFYSAASGKRTVYILPLYPALALLLGAWWQELRRGTIQLPGVLSRLLQGGGYLGFCSIILAIGIVIGQLLGHDPLGLIRPFLHPKDQSNLPFFSDVVTHHSLAFLFWFSVVGPSALILLYSIHRQRWGWLFTSLVVFTGSTFLLVNNVFQPIIANARTFKPFMARVIEQTREAPLFFYKAFDNGALYYADRRIPHYDSTLVALDQSFFLLMWEDEWRKIAAQSASGLRDIDISEGTGPKGKLRLVLVSVTDGAQIPAAPASSEEEDAAEDDTL